MNLMSGSTSYQKLAKKYRNFGAPTVRIFVDDVEVTEKFHTQIAGVYVELTTQGAASGCSFDVVCEYEPQKTNFAKHGAAKLLQLGAVVELQLGYIETVSVFYGLIVEVEYEFSGEDAPCLHVECMDAKCLLMKQKRLAVFCGKSATQIIAELFNAQPFCSYIKGKSVEPHAGKMGMVVAADEDDYQLASRYAEQIGYEFFILAGKVYLRKAPVAGTPILTLSPEHGLISFKLSLRGSALYKKTKVVGINPENNQVVSGEAVLNGRLAKGRNIGQMLGNSAKAHFDHSVRSADEAAARADLLMHKVQSGFGSLQCECIGLPELVPGRTVTIQGISAEADRNYYIHSVCHRFDERGFYTTLEGRLDKL